MKVVILAGGFGTRISEESQFKPKPMIEIGGKPILWHIMKSYSYYGYNDFVICAGYKQHVIKEFFANYFVHTSDITFDFSKDHSIHIWDKHSEPWRVTVVDTGLNTMTGGRIKRISKYIDDDNFMLTYGDGLSDVNINELVKFHMHTQKIATITAVQPGGKFGALEITNDATISNFAEKKLEDGGWINGGFMVLKTEIFDYIDGDATTFEKEPLEKVCSEHQMAAFKHIGFWKCMDTLRDKVALEEMFASGNAPWKLWND
jgi:glucose-1-phosphate cytidylyltransferase